MPAKKTSSRSSENKMLVTTCSKRWDDFPAAHRQPKHKGHCALLHGHNWSFKVRFEARYPDENGFVYDFGELKEVKAWLNDQFDHTLLLNKSDPALDYFTRTLGGDVYAKIVTVENCGAEGLARHVFDYVNQYVKKKSAGRVCVVKVTCYEDGKNSAQVSHKNL